MSQFVDLTMNQFERAYERHRMRIAENAKQIRLFDHRIVELVCMDGRVPPIVPYGLAPIIPIAGGVPREGNHLYEAWLDHVIVSEQKRKHGTIQLIQLHTECAAFERNTETALNAALGFTGNLQEQYEKNVHGMILLYNVVHGGVSASSNPFRKNGMTLRLSSVMVNRIRTVASTNQAPMSTEMHRLCLMLHTLLLLLDGQSKCLAISCSNTVNLQSLQEM